MTRVRFRLAMDQAAFGGTTGLKSTANRASARPDFGLAEEAQSQQPDQDQVDGHDDIEKTRDNKNKNTGNECNDRLQMRNTDGHDVLPLWLITEMKRRARPAVPLYVMANRLRRFSRARSGIIPRSLKSLPPPGWPRGSR